MHEELKDSKTISWAPLLASILDSSVWVGTTPETKLVWITMLAKKNYKGYVDMSLPGLAKAAEVPLSKAKEAVAILESPDPLSRNKNDEGRRIKAVDGGGWLVLNHGYYRDIIATARRRDYLRRWAKNSRDKAKDANGRGNGIPTEEGC